MQIIGRPARSAGNALKREWDFHLSHVDFDRPVPSCISARPASRGGYGGVVTLTRGWRVTICRRRQDPQTTPDARGIPVVVFGDNIDATFAAAIELLRSRVTPREYVSVHELMGGSWYTPRDVQVTRDDGRRVEPVE